MKKLFEKVDRLMMASVMAEANAHELGRDYLQPDRVRARLHQGDTLQDFLENVGLNCVPVYYGVAQR